MEKIKLLFIPLILLFVSCGLRQTIHERCMDPRVASRYKNYSQCYDEESEGRERTARALKTFGEGLQNSSKSNNPIHCKPDYTGGYRCN